MISLGVNEHKPTVQRYIRVIRKRIRININAQDYKVPIQQVHHAMNKPIQDINNISN